MPIKIRDAFREMEMDYTNTYDVRFKIIHHSENTYCVRYYPGGKSWPRTYRAFNCPTEECRREMFYVLNNSRLCMVCRDDIINHRGMDGDPVCRKCILRRAQTEALNEECIPECPVCYQKILLVDNSKHILPCKHEICKGCFKRMLKLTSHIHFNGYRPTQVGVIACPMCRQEAFYEFSSFRQVLPGSVI